MPRLEPHQTFDIEVMHAADVPVAEIAQRVGCARSTVYGIIDNLQLHGRPYPPTEAYRVGRLPKLAPGHVQVCIYVVVWC
jgi:IS30 family transposase